MDEGEIYDEDDYGDDEDDDDDDADDDDDDGDDDKEDEDDADDADGVWLMDEGEQSDRRFFQGNPAKAPHCCGIHMSSTTPKD